MLTAGIMKAVTGLPANPCITLGSIDAMAVSADSLRLKAVVPSNSVLEKECTSSAVSSGSRTLRALQEGGSGGNYSPITISAVSK